MSAIEPAWPYLEPPVVDLEAHNLLKIDHFLASLFQALPLKE
jgi:hypothetical protein